MGTVGTGVARLLLEQRELLRSRTGIDYCLKAAVDVRWDRVDLDLAGVVCSEDPAVILEDPEIKVVVETIGGTGVAYDLVQRAIRAGKHVVTANKALIATKGRELFRLARAHQVDLLFEASVGGGIPIIKGLKEGLVGNKILSIEGILNGTSNYVLTKMYEDGMEFDEALGEAQAKGFAEADPTLDISGYDAAHKLAILASIVSSTVVDFEKIHVEGITEITKMDIDFARNFGYVIKLLAIIKNTAEGLDLRVHPTLVPKSHLLASVNYELNAVSVTGDFVGNTVFYGPGAGQRPTASAVVSDIVDLSRDLLLRNGVGYCNRTIDPCEEPKLVPLDQVSNRFYIRFFAYDAPGILAQVGSILGKLDISIASVLQMEIHGKDNYVPLVIITHLAKEAAMKEAMEELAQQDYVRGKPLCLRLHR